MQTNIQNKWIKLQVWGIPVAKPCGQRKKKKKSLHNTGQALPLRMRCCFGYGGEETHRKDSLFVYLFSVLVSLKDPSLHSVLLY